MKISFIGFKPNDVILPSCIKNYSFRDEFIPNEFENGTDIIIMSEQEALIYASFDRTFLADFSKEKCPILVLKPGFGNFLLKGTCVVRKERLIVTTAKTNSSSQRVDMTVVLKRLIDKDVAKTLPTKLLEEIKQLNTSAKSTEFINPFPKPTKLVIT